MTSLIRCTSLSLALFLCVDAALAADIGALKAQALSKEMSPRRKALKGLAAEGSPDAIKAILEAAKAGQARSDTIAVRDVAYTLRGLQNPAAGPVLLAALAAPDVDRKTLGPAIVEALGNTRDPTATPALRKLLEKPDDKPMYRNAYEALAKVTNDPADVARYAADLKDRKTSHEAIKAMRSLENPALAAALYPLLRDPAIEVPAVEAVIGALGRMAQAEAAVPLLDLVERDERRGVAGFAARALVTCAEPQHVPRMLKIISAKNANRGLNEAFIAADRRQGYQALKGLLGKDPSLAGTLLYTMGNNAHPSDEDIALRALATKPVPRTGDTLRRAGVYVLARLDSARVEQALCTELKDKSNTSSLRTDCIEGLERLATDGAVRCLIDVMETESKLKASSPRQFSINVFEDTAKALGHITGEKLGEDAAAWRTWHTSGLKAGVDGLVQGLAHQDAGARALSAQRLRDLARKDDLKKPGERDKVRDALMQALPNERASNARLPMVEALGALRDTKALDVLVGVLDKGSANSLDEKVALARALDELGDGRGTATLIEQLAAEKDEDRMNAAKALSLVTGEPLHYDAAQWRAWWKTYAERYRR